MERTRFGFFSAATLVLCFSGPACFNSKMNFENIKSPIQVRSTSPLPTPNPTSTTPTPTPIPSPTPSPTPSPILGLYYSANPARYSVGLVIATNSLQTTGTGIKSAAVTPPLPAGLTLDPVTGAISGTPLGPIASPGSVSSHIVTASDGQRTGSVTLQLSIGNPSWTEVPRSGKQPAARSDFSTVWTGSQFVVWGGHAASGVVMNTGGIFDPNTQSWKEIPLANAPTARAHHTAVLIGSEMIVWGGNDGISQLADGAILNLDTLTWSLLPTTNALTPREGHTAVVVGNEMIVWGGFRIQGNKLVYRSTGAAYDAVKKLWTALPATPFTFAGRELHSAVSTGNKMILWGGFDGVNPLADGAVYDPAQQAWSQVPASIDSPSARAAHSAVWTGTQMIVWGGEGTLGIQLGNGGIYDPSTGKWTAIASTNVSPAARAYHRADWTGSRMIVWGGDSFLGTLGDGGVFDPSAANWIPLAQSASSPSARSRFGSAWDGPASRFLIWGGYQSQITPVLDDGGILK